MKARVLAAVLVVLLGLVLYLDFGDSGSTSPLAVPSPPPDPARNTMIVSQGPATPPRQVYQIGADFSVAENPHGVWQYGYSQNNSLSPDQFQLDTAPDVRGPVGFWHPAKVQGPGAGYYPYVAANTAGATCLDPTKSWAVRAGEVAMEASNSGQYSIVRFVAPRAGTYQVNAFFEGIHSGLSTTDVHVLLNDRSLFDAFVEGYGGDPSFHIVVGPSPRAFYSGTLELKAGDIVTFAVGCGRNRTNYCDTTGLLAKVQLF